MKAKSLSFFISFWYLFLAQSGNGKGLELSREGQAVSQAIMIDKPNDPQIYVVDRQAAGRISLREGGLLQWGKRLKLEYAAYLVGAAISARDDLDHLSLLYFDPRHRSNALDYYILSGERQDLYLNIDQVNLRTNFRKLRVVAGRAAIDLSKSFIFRPNDLFGPLNSNQVDPYHKTGVDSIQISGPLAPLGEWKLMMVAGYEPITEAEADFDGRYLKGKNYFSGKQSSILASYVNTLAEYFLQFNVGTYRDQYILMGSIEGDINKTWGLRSEGKHLTSRSDQSRQFSWTIGLDYRFDEKNLIFSELYLNGEGYGSAREYEQIDNSAYRPLAHFGRNYLGLGVNSELTPLLTVRVVGQYNANDASTLMTSNVNYSVNDQIDISVLLVSGIGAKPEDGILQSEYGTYPRAFGLQSLFRW